MIDPIQKELEAAILDLRVLVRDAGSAIPLHSFDRWDVFDQDGKRLINLERAIETDYDKFLYHQFDTLLRRETVKSAASSVREHPIIQEALSIASSDPTDKLLCDYILPMCCETLKREDQGVATAEAIADVFRLVDDCISVPTREVKYTAPLSNFRCTENALELSDGLWIRRIPNEEMAGHLNALATTSNFHEFHDIEFQLELATKENRPGAPISPTFPTDMYKIFSQMEEALRVLKAGAVGIRFRRAQTSGLFGPGASMAYLSTGMRLHADKDSFTYQLTKDDGPLLVGVYESLKKCRKDKRFSVALRRFSGSYTKPLGDDRVLDYWIALEALILPDGKEGELTTKGATRLAWLLGTKKDRAEIFRRVKKSYKLRSDIAHGEQTSVPAQEVIFLETIVRDTMRRCLSRGSAPSQEWLNALVLDVLTEDIELSS